MKDRYYTCLEITSKSIKMVIGNVVKDRVYIIDAIEEKVDGVRKGLITNQELIEEKIKIAKEKLEKNHSFKIKDITLVIPSFNLTCMSDSCSSVTASRDGIIENNDIRDIVFKMKKRKLGDSSLKIIDCVPSFYIINGSERYSYPPLGKKTEQLTVSAYLYAMDEKVFNSYMKIAQNLDLNVEYYVSSACASALYLSTLENIPDQYIMLDIGHSLTSVSHIVSGKEVVNSKLIDFGGDHITKSIVERLDVTYGEAEELKITFGIENNLAFPILIKDQHSFDDLSDAIYASFNNFFKVILSAIRGFNISKDENVPLVLVGGSSMLNGLDKLLSKELNVDIIDYSTNTLGARSKSFINVLGAIKYSKIQPVVEDEEQVISTITRVDVFSKRKLGELEDEL